MNELKLTFNTDKETFELAKKCFRKNKYPFRASAETRKKFDAFMIEYIIDECYIN